MRVLPIVTALLLLLFLTVPAHCGGQQQENTQIHALQTDFVQEKELAILARPLISRGKLFFQAPDSLRWEYTAPIRSILLLHRGESRKFVMEDGRWREVRSMAAQGLAMILTDMTGWLRGDFHETKTFSVRRARGLIRLIPKQKGLQNVISEIILRPGPEPGLLDSVTIVEGKDATTTMTFKNARLNQPIAEKLFTRP